MTFISKHHLEFLEESKREFEYEPLFETWRNDDETLIALRTGADRDCIEVYELGDRVANFTQQIKPIRLNKTIIKQEEL
ncbi:MAG TPA: hypothetical protein VK094_00145 [Pseudogracilibacillus sp.]|nr:hypothetical protein [Pseudogracilibacillus sp.]